MVTERARQRYADSRGWTAEQIQVPTAEEKREMLQGNVQEKLRLEQTQRVEEKRVLQMKYENNLQKGVRGKGCPGRNLTS